MFALTVGGLTDTYPSNRGSDKRSPCLTTSYSCRTSKSTPNVATKALMKDGLDLGLRRAFLSAVSELSFFSDSSVESLGLSLEASVFVAARLSLVLLS